MPVSEQERSLRRRIVFSAMNGKATPAAIQSAINLLDSEFGDVEKIRFNRLIQRLGETLDAAEANLGKILGEIMVLRSKPADQIGPDPRSGTPVSTTVAAAPKAKPATSERSGLDDVFATMIETLVENLKHRGDGSEQQLLSEIQASPAVTKLGARMADPLAAYAKAPAPGTLQCKGMIEEYRAIVHVVYLWICKKLGPVEADQAINAMVRTAEQRPAAVSNPPRQLL